MNKREDASWNTGRDNLEGTQMPGSPAKLYKMRFSHGKRYSLLESLPRKMFRLAVVVRPNKGIGDAGSTADFRMLWSAMVCLCLL